MSSSQSSYNSVYEQEEKSNSIHNYAWQINRQNHNHNQIRNQNNQHNQQINDHSIDLTASPYIRNRPLRRKKRSRNNMHVFHPVLPMTHPNDIRRVLPHANNNQNNYFSQNHIRRVLPHANNNQNRFFSQNDIRSEISEPVIASPSVNVQSYAYLTTLRGIQVRGAFSFKCFAEPDYDETILQEIAYVKEDNFYIGIGKLIRGNSKSAINLWKECFSRDTTYGCNFRLIYSNVYKTKKAVLINTDDVSLHGDLQLEANAENDINNNEIDWKLVYEDVRKAVFQEHLTKQDYMLKYASESEQIGFKAFINNASKLYGIIEKCMSDYSAVKQQHALKAAYEFVDETINNDPEFYLFLKQLAWLILRRHHRFIWWLYDLNGEKYKSSLLKAIRYLMGRLVFVLTTFGNMNHLCNLLKKNPYIAALSIDLAKTGSKDIITTVFEQLKNGYMSSIKFDGFNSVTKPIGLVICSNEPAPVDQFTQNRLFELQIIQNGHTRFLEITGDEVLANKCPDMPSDDVLNNLTLKQIAEQYNNLNTEI